MNQSKPTKGWLLFPLGIVLVFAAAAAAVCLLFGDKILSLLDVAMKLVVIP
ncbi:MAG: hypothetical protein Q4C54_00145 [Clostridia bacterium]|nr:hypothetical protein [Clostridia bacterium]